MNSAIRFLEEMGRQPQMPHGAVMDAVQTSGLDDQQRDAMLSADFDALNRLLDARPTMCCAIFEPLKQPDRQQPDEESPDEADEPDESEQSQS